MYYNVFYSCWLQVKIQAIVRSLPAFELCTLQMQQALQVCYINLLRAFS